MREKQFGWRRDNLSAAANTPSNDKPDDKSKDTPAVDQPPTQPEDTPSEVAPAPKL